MNNKLKISIGIFVVVIILGIILYFVLKKSETPTATSSPTTIATSIPTATPIATSIPTATPIATSIPTATPTPCEECMKNCNKIVDRNDKLVCQLTKCGSLCV